MSRKTLYLAPQFRRRGFNALRLLKDGEGEGGNNQSAEGGNSDTGATGGSDSNNAGTAFDPAAFWADPNPDAGQSPSGESATGQQGEESGSSGGNLQEVLTGRLESMTFGDPVLNDDIAREINEGNFEGFQKRLEASQRNAVKHAMGMMVQILRPFSEQLTAQMRGEMQTTFNSRDNSETLESMFPAAKNKSARPVIQNIYDQALKNTKGDRASAVAQTKEMLRFLGNQTADDLDITVHPRGAEDSGRPASPTTNWLDELSGR